MGNGIRWGVASVGLLLAVPFSVVYAQGLGGPPVNEPGQPPVHVHPTVGNAGAHGGGPPASNLTYHGGTADGAAGVVGVETAPRIYLVLWGSQWNNNDPSGEAALLESFYRGAGGS